MRRRLAYLLLCALVLAPATTAAKRPQQHWASKQIAVVVERGLLGEDSASFRPDEAVTHAELAEALTALELAPPVAANADTEVTIAQLNATVVRALGLKDTAYRFAQAMRRAGVKPTSRFGTEVVARLLGLRTNHLQANETLELAPGAPATRAEAAYSVARVLELDESSLESVKEASKAIVLPVYEGRIREVLQLAVSLVGNPYVWGGTSERPQTLFGRLVPGGFDCSGFTWRVYKSFAEGGVLRGRTSMAMSGEVPKALQIAREALAPGDVVFFGAKGAKSKPAQVDHMGIYLGGDWIVHSTGSTGGVGLSPLTGWYAERFAWGRRPLAEAV